MRHYADKMAYSRRIEKEGREENANGGGVVYQSAPEPAEGPWYSVDSGSFTATPASTSRLTMSDTSMLALGMALRYSILGDNYYGVVAAISDNAYIDVMGAPLIDDVDALSWSERVEELDIFIAGKKFASTSTNLLKDVMKVAEKTWNLGAAYLVGFRVILNTADSTSGPAINIVIDGGAVSTSAPLATGTMGDNGAVAIDPALYGLDWRSTITASCPTAAGTGDAADLSIECVFVLE